MSKKIRVVMAQLNFLVGDIAGNLQKHITGAITARDTLKADVIVFPELSITGYPPEDLLLRKSFIEEANAAISEIQAQVQNIYCVVGHPLPNSKGLHNTCSVIYNGGIIARYNKQHLPNYGVFDEARYFIPGESNTVINLHGVPVGVAICEDLWFPGPTQAMTAQGARLILSPNASPFETDKHDRRVEVISKRASANKIPIIYVNSVGGQDDLVFDGGSMVADAAGNICQHAGFFNETLMPVDIEVTPNTTEVSALPFDLPSEEETIYRSLMLGLRDYVEKNHFPGALLGLSGGIDSALTLTLAVDALGKDRVKAIIMPSRYTANISVEDAKTLANNIGVAHETISIEPTYQSFLTTLAPIFGDKKPDITEQNLQARCRGVILMALSNASGNILLTTGNRSELAVGYATLYGDMAGGYAVLKDIPKTLVYRLAEYRNAIDSVIPERIIHREPTAELAPDQKDQDTLPPYEVLDSILELYLNEEKSIDDIIAQGFDAAVVYKVVNLIHKNEYKRRQAAVGTRINHTAFGKDRRYPMTSGFKK